MRRKQVLLRPEPRGWLLRLAARLPSLAGRHLGHLNGRPIGLQFGDSQPSSRQQPRHPVQRQRRLLRQRWSANSSTLVSPAVSGRRPDLRALWTSERQWRWWTELDSNGNLQRRSAEDAAQVTGNQQDQDQGAGPRPDAHRGDPQAVYSGQSRDRARYQVGGEDGLMRLWG